ncbi:SEC-C motif-containing protein [Peptoclostridium litorale DSM 5388]|uniref:SEC-C motif-containing protein n=1 Tax=Peptoclostridium litorale DSM 5388 TaxID=1121324 RepID=A0A069RQK1_PEPLI|nr:SEC-C metal-binding domain-containing protein [Peptoclostridium litorale]KDR96452.1 hypothetical protein CLIT_2c00580 [Peptoclostridium litorale DSM 5388]SIN70425.1 SEC-C motif-containing protein [Peptoclostridium litorale DSM 5388]
MKEKVLLDCIKGEPKGGLIECLMSCKKKKLIEIAQMRGTNVAVSWTKSKMSEKLSQDILENFKDDIAGLDKNTVEFLRSMAGRPAKDMSDIKYEEYKNLEKKGSVFLYNLNGDIYPVIPKELSTMIEDALAGEVVENVKDDQHISYTTALVNIYGACRFDQFANVWNSHNREKLTLDEAKTCMETHASSQGAFRYEDGCIISNRIKGEQEYSEFLKKVAKRPYYMPTKTEISFYSKNEFDKESLHYKKFESFVKARCEDQNHAHYIISGILDMCIVEKYTYEAAEMLLEENGFSLEGEKDEFSKIITDLMSNMKRWALRGAMPSQFTRANEVPFLDVLSMKHKQAVQGKVGRNDPCPCGSKVKYKKCCGKGKA